MTRPQFVPVIQASGVENIRVVVAPVDPPITDSVVPFVVDKMPEPDDVSCIIYTSGTTGPAKGVVITWAQMSAMIGRIPRGWLSADDAVYSPWPMFHVTGQSPLISMADVGGRVVLFGKVGEEGRRFLDRFDTIGIGFYGSTEVGFPVANRPIGKGTEHLAGWLRPGYECRVVDDAGNDVGEGRVGELWIRPPDRRLIMREYLNQPQRTSKAIVDGWYRTGDAVRQHDDGSLEFVDRLGDTIRRFGENISSAALEASVMADHEVRECRNGARRMRHVDTVVLRGSAWRLRGTPLPRRLRTRARWRGQWTPVR